MRASCKRTAAAQNLASGAEATLEKGHLVLLTWFPFRKGKDLKKQGRCSGHSLHFRLSVQFLAVECFQQQKVFSSGNNKVMKVLKLKTEYL